MEHERTLSLRNSLDEIPRLAEELEAFAEAHGIAPDVVFSVSLALDEVVTNVVRYAFPEGGDETRTPVIEVHLGVTEGTLQATVRDNGRPFDPLTEVPPPDLDADLDSRAVGGLGVHFVRTLMDGSRYARVDGCNELVFYKNL